MIKKIFNKILGFIVPGKVTDSFKTVQNFLNGKKTYLAGAIVLLQALMLLLEQFLSMNGIADALSAVKNFAQSDGFVRLAEALAIFGIRAALPFKKA